MANNLKKFTTEAEYSAATLNYPAVSWVTSGDTVHFDKTAPVPTVNRKVKIAFTTDSCASEHDFLLADNNLVYNLDSITINGEPAEVASSVIMNLENNTDYLIEYELKEGVTNVYDWLTFIDLDILGCYNAPINYDILIPAQVTDISMLGDSVGNIILESTTPPTLEHSMSSFNYGIYVPTASINAYKESSGWSSFSSEIHPISEYQGNIPV
jgi:hypothetical protein